MSPWQQRLGTYTEKLDSKKLKLKSGPCEENRVLRSDPHGRDGILRVFLVSNRTPHTRVTSSITITWIKTLDCSRTFQLCSASRRWPCVRKALQNDKEDENSPAVTLINNATLGQRATLGFGRVENPPRRCCERHILHPSHGSSIRDLGSSTPPRFTPATSLNTAVWYTPLIFCTSLFSFTGPQIYW